MAITTKDLAQLCGVSRTTIHRALNGTGRIKPETKEMILQVARNTATGRISLPPDWLRDRRTTSVSSCWT